MLPNLALHSGPSWRYSEAERCLRQRPVAQPRVNDEYINNYIKVVKALNSSTSGLMVYKLSTDPVLSHYYTFHQLLSNPSGTRRLGESQQTANFTRSILEALALCDTDPDEIATLVGVSPKTVEIYESMVFDVRDKPEFWRVSHILSPIINSFATGNFDSLLKFAAAVVGRSAVDQLLFKSSLSRENILKIRETVYGWRLLKSAASSVMIPVNSFNNLEFERDVHSAFIEEEKLEAQKKALSNEQPEDANRDDAILDVLFGKKPITISSKYRPNEELGKSEEQVVSTNLQNIMNETLTSNDVVRQP